MENTNELNYIDNDARTSNAIDILSNINLKDDLFNQNLLNSLKIIKSLSYDLINYDLLVEKNFHQILYNLLNNVYEQLCACPIHDNNDKIHIDYQSDDFERCVIILYLCQMIINYIYPKSFEFINRFISKGGLRANFLFLENTTLRNILNTRVVYDIEEIDLIENIALNIYNFSELSLQNLEIWNELDAIRTLLDLVKINKKVKLDVYLTITFIATDAQIETMTELHSIIEYLKTNLKKIAEQFRQNKFNREKRQVYLEDCIKMLEMHCIFDNNRILTSIDVFIKALYRLLVNDKLRTTIYSKQGFANDLKTILVKGNFYEKICALRLYTQLSFNSEISNSISQDNEIIQVFNEKKNEKDKTTAKLCEQILWNIEKNRTTKELVKNTGEHIMISYNSASRDLCLKIKSAIENLGFKVWIDVEKIHGSSLDSMAKAVENSLCVLICITEKYRMSEFCQAEATYAFRLKKPIIPLIMQNGYENVQGWLGIIQKDKMNVNFIKYNFDECIKKLKRELDNLPVMTESKVEIISSKPIEKLVEKWDEKQVKEWFKSNNLNILIFEKINIFDGTILQQLYEMRRDAPEFYFQMFNTNSIDIASMLKFTHCMKKLLDIKKS